MNSIWKKLKTDSIFGYELDIAQDKSCHIFFKPHPIFEWISKNNAEDKLFKALDKLCPLKPLESHRGEPGLYLSAPQSGLDSAVFIVIGKDSSNKLRVIGCNWINPSFLTFKAHQQLKNIYSVYDQLQNDVEREELIRSEVFRSMTTIELGLLNKFKEEAFKYGTAVVVIMVVDNSNRLFAIDTALVKTVSSGDFSQEFVGEII